MSESRVLPLSYRQQQVSMIMRSITAGDSCLVIGVSGMGKSNFFRHLLNPITRAHYLGERWQSHLFVAVDCHALSDYSERAMNSLLINRLMVELGQHGTGEKVMSGVEQLQAEILGSTDPVAIRMAFSRAIQMTMSQLGRLVFLFDQFDEVCCSLPPQFFPSLRALRDEFKYSLSYVVFTRDDISDLCHMPELEEFYELLSPNTLNLGPYDRQDAALLISRVTSRYGETLPERDCERLIYLTGGHPGLLRASCMAFLHKKVASPESTEQALKELLAVQDVRAECAKLLASLSAPEQKALRQLAVSAQVSPEDAEALRRLQSKKLVSQGGDNLTPFCQIFTRYLIEQKTDNVAGTRIQAGPIRIDVNSEVWINGQQVIPSLSKKELSLLEYLCLEPYRLRTKDEIIAIVYPEEYKTGETVSDDALNALVKRLRDHINPFSPGNNYIATLRGKGYRLQID